MRWGLLGLLLLVSTLTVADDDRARTTAATCCAARLMDSGNRVVLEPRMELDVRHDVEYQAVSLFNLCSRDAFYLQIWRSTDPSDPMNKIFELRWQVFFSSNANRQLNMNPNNYVTIHEDDRIGMFSNDEDHDQKFPVQYMDKSDVVDMNKKNTPVNIMWRSKAEYESHVFTIGEQIEMDTLIWPRTMSPYVTFCRTSACEEVTLAAEAQGVPGPPGPPGTEGPEGPQGQCESFQCTISADLTDEVGNLPGQLEQLGRDTEKINQEVETVKEMLTRLLGSNTPTGLCPSGFTAGSYGVGSCYLAIRRLMPMASAGMVCRTTHQDAILAHIPTSAHESFLYDYITRTYPAQAGSSEMTVETEVFWTRGMYSVRSGDWLWYLEQEGTKEQMDYLNFIDDDFYKIGGERCLALNIDYTNHIAYWTSERCGAQHYVLCETPKKCL